MNSRDSNEFGQREEDRQTLKVNQALLVILLLALFLYFNIVDVHIRGYNPKGNFLIIKTRLTNWEQTKGPFIDHLQRFTLLTYA